MESKHFAPLCARVRGESARWTSNVQLDDKVSGNLKDSHPPIPPRYPRAAKPSPQINTLGAQVAQVRLSCLNPAHGGTGDGGVGNRFCRDATVPHCWRGR